MTNITLNCKAIIEKYNNGMYGIVIKHKDRRLILIKDTDPTLLWDSNYGYDIEFDDASNFKISYNAEKSKICKSCGKRIDWKWLVE